MFITFQEKISHIYLTLIYDAKDISGTLPPKPRPVGYLKTQWDTHYMNTVNLCGSTFGNGEPGDALAMRSFRIFRSSHGFFQHCRHSSDLPETYWLPSNNLCWSYRAEDNCCLSMTYPRDILCCFRNRLSGMLPALESSCQNSAQRSRLFIKHTLIYYFLFLPLGPAPAPGGEVAASPAGTGAGTGGS